MCGICGSAGVATDSEKIRAMLCSISHRGPDSERFVFDEGMAFGFARLSIVDLAGGEQPFVSPETGICAMTNGEIYNQGSLRSELHDLGHSFHSKSDCEVVLRGYEEWGEGVFGRLRGMFASAIWDPRDKKVILARDPLGKKPLYWFFDGNSLLFASEIKALFAAGVPRVVDHESLLRYLVLDSVPTPGSMVRGIRKLRPGTTLSWTPGGRPAEISFWPNGTFASVNSSFEEWFGQLEDLLYQSVSRRLMADVPIGVFLSSGIDSTLIAGIAKELSTTQLNAYTLEFEAASYNEFSNAKKTASALGLLHHRIPANSEDLVWAFDAMTRIFDEPVNDPAILPMLLLARGAREDVKVVLTGDGGDELFYGYQHIWAHLLCERFPESSRLLSYPISLAARVFPDSGSYFSTSFKLQRLARGLGVNNLYERDLAWRGAFKDWHAVNILNTDLRNSLTLDLIQGPTEGITGSAPIEGSPLAIWSWWYLRSYLMDTVLVKVDRASMAFGVEPRSPLLDQDLVTHALRAPAEWKIGRGRDKALLRHLAAKHVPLATMPKRKHGMGVPTKSLLFGDLRARLIHYTSRSYVHDQGIFDPGMIEVLTREFFDGRRDLRKEIWGFFVFQEWHSYWINQSC
jgi:asparagine synthase (glutamine-hydrolysing)